MSKMRGFKLLVQGVVRSSQANNAFAEALTRAVERAIQDDCGRFDAHLGTLQIRIDPIDDQGSETVHTRTAEGRQ